MRFRAIMALPKWQSNGGRDFAFYHSHSGFEWEDVDITNKYMDMLCQDFQVFPLSHTSAVIVTTGILSTFSVCLTSKTQHPTPLLPRRCTRLCKPAYSCRVPANGDCMKLYSGPAW